MIIMRLLYYCIFIFLIATHSSYARIAVDKSDEIIYVNYKFNGTKIHFFGAHQNVNKSDKVYIDIIGPEKKFKIRDYNKNTNDIITMPSFIETKNINNENDSRITHYLEQNRLARKSDKAVINNNLLFHKSLFIPSNAPLGKYNVIYYLFNKAGQKTIFARDHFEVKKTILLEKIKQFTVNYPWFNASFTILLTAIFSIIMNFIIKRV